MHKPEIRPLVTFFGYSAGPDKLIFVCREGNKIIDGCSKEIIDILKHCNGLNTVSNIKSRLPWITSRKFHLLLKLLLEQGILCDSCSIYESFHKDSSNPMEFSFNWSEDQVAQIEKEPKRKTALKVESVISLEDANSDFLSLIRSRRTIRRFRDVSISEIKLAGLLESMNRTNGSRSIPSAGGLYPLEVYFALLKKVGKICPGWYQYSADKQEISLLNIPSGLERVCQILDSSEVIKNATLVVFLGADFSRTTLKYSNRGYRFVMMEIGHAAQNANLYCIENGLGAVEWGGFNDLQIARELQIDYPRQAIALAMVVGLPDENKVQHIHEPFYDESRKLKVELLGKDKPVRLIRLGELIYGNYTMPRVVATAKYASITKSKRGRNLAFASGRTVAEASVKVMAEAFERYASGCLRIDMVSSAMNLDKPFIDPMVINPMDDRQYEILNLKPFDYQKDWQWISGYRLVDGQQVYVPIDNVFYPLNATELGRNLCCFTNSSGVAAHFKKNIAIQKGLLELIERDAIAVTWGTKRNVTALPHNIIDKNTRSRVEFWESQKRKVKFLNITIDSVPVVVCLIFSDNSEYPCLVSGAAADFSFRLAMEKAFNEAEYMLLSWYKAKPKRVSKLEDVVSVLDHGRLYFYPGQLQHLSWLLDANEKQPEKFGRMDIFSQFNPVIVDITPNINTSLSVIRVLSDVLMPLSFGYGSEYYKHSRLKMLGLDWKREFPAQPHFFA